MFKSENAGVSWVFGTLKTFKKYILKLLNNMQRSVLLRVVRVSSFCCLTIKKLRERRGLGNLRHFKDQPTEKYGIVYDNLFLSSQAPLDFPNLPRVDEFLDSERKPLW